MTIKAAVIGAGSMGCNHLRVYTDMETVEVVGIADVNEAAARKAVHSYRVNFYTDYEQMLDREKPDLVSVAVPTEYHMEVASQAISRGISVLVEKPLAFTLAEGQQIIDMAKRYKVKLMVGHVERFNPAVIEIKNRLDRQELGRIFQVHARRLSPFPSRIRDVGVILDLATHDIDVMRYLLGCEVERVYAEIEQKAHKTCEDLLSGLLRFNNGVIGVLDVNWLTPAKVRQLAVLGEGGMYLVDYLTQDAFWYKNGKNGNEAAAWNTLSIFRGVSEGEMVKLHFNKKEPLRAELDSFVKAVSGDQEPAITGRDGLAAVDLACKLLESSRTHMPASLPPQMELS